MYVFKVLINFVYNSDVILKDNPKGTDSAKLEIIMNYLYTIPIFKDKIVTKLN